jgi:hypothetical protein
MARGKPKTLLLYWSATGNTGKVAGAIEKALRAAGIEPVMKKIAEAASEELYDYDLIFLGSPSYSFLPPPPVLKYVEQKMKLHRERGDIKLGAPEIPGKTAVVFCTFSGPHTGINEAVPVGDYLGQFFAHLGYRVAEKWYTVGEFHGHEEFSTRGRMGNIKGRPNAQDLLEIEGRVAALLKSL